MVAGLTQASLYEPKVTSFFSWLGVTYYLTPEAVLATLRGFAEVACSGSGIVFDYLDLDAFDNAKTTVRVRQMQEIARRAGEPMKAGFDPGGLAAQLAGLGLILDENLSPGDIETRYFAGRTDGYHAFEHVHFARVVVARPSAGASAIPTGSLGNGRPPRP